MSRGTNGSLLRKVTTSCRTFFAEAGSGQGSTISVGMTGFAQSSSNVSGNARNMSTEGLRLRRRLVNDQNNSPISFSPSARTNGVTGATALVTVVTDTGKIAVSRPCDR